MKKWIVLTIAVLVVIAVLVPAAFAQGPANNGMNVNETPLMNGPHGNGTGAGQCDNFVDEDGDGVCDLAGTGQGQGQGQGTGSGYVDEDGDGVCDHAGTGQGQQGQHGQRGGQGMRGSQGMRGQQAQ